MPGKSNAATDATSRSPSASTAVESPIAHLASIIALRPAADEATDKTEVELAASIVAATVAMIAISWVNLSAAAAVDA